MRSAASESRGRFDGGPRFTIIGELGSGGSGTVYEAVDEERGARVAIKTLRALSPERVLQFKHEFRVLADLHHRNLVTLGELFEHAGQWFFTMELVPGVDLVSYVRGDDAALGAETESLTMQSGERDRDVGGAVRPVVDEARLRSALPQLASALAALHAAGKIHLDVKPSNIRVRPDGTLLLLDFGLVADTTTLRADTGALRGTPAYMAPEVATGGAVGPAADWYAVGVVLHRCLTGAFPFEGPVIEVLRAKVHVVPPPVRALTPEAPRDLATLCDELLARDPLARPSGARILDRLAAKAAPRPLGTRLPLVGRAEELSTCVEACRAGWRGGAAHTLVVGVAGIGKTAFLHALERELARTDEQPLVLSGRCLARENIPFRAMDLVVQNLIAHLASLDTSDRAALLGDDAELVARLFPSWPVGARSEVDALIPRGELRARAFRALRGVVARVAQRRPLAIVIDDLHWADADGLALLRDLLSDTPNVVLVASARPGAAAAAQFAWREVPLGPLPESHALALALALLEERAAPSDRAQAVARESAGHPLFIIALAQEAYVAASTLDEAIRARLASLDPQARRALSLVALAVAPLSYRAWTTALGTEHDAIRVSTLLRSERLIHSDDAGRAFETYHDKIRENALALLAPAESRAYSEQIARALETTGDGSAEALAAHWSGAGNLARAVDYAVRAGDEAATALAFECASRLYRMAIGWIADGSARELEVRLRLAQALANDTHSAEAAREFVSASHMTSDQDRALALRSRAAWHLLSSGHIDEGLRVVEGVLGPLGLHLARSPATALAGLLARRAWLRLRGVGFHERPAAGVSAAKLARIDACWSVASGLGMVDTIRGADLQARNLLLALDAGEPSRVGRALVLEAAYASTAGSAGQRRSQMLIDRAEQLAREGDDRYVAAIAEAARGVRETLLGQFRGGLEHSDRATAMLRTDCRDVTWERDCAELYALMSLANLGELPELSSRVRAQLEAAIARDDLYAATNLRVGWCVLPDLARDDLESARRGVHEAMSRWSSVGFHVQHLSAMQAEIEMALYEGDGAHALAIATERWTGLSRSLLLQFQLFRIAMVHLRARAGLAVLRDRGPDPRLVSRVTTDSRRLAREPVPYAAALAGTLRAGIAAARGDRESCAGELHRAFGAFRQADMGLWSASVGFTLGTLLRNEEGRGLRAAALESMAERGVASPERLARALVPLPVH